MRLRSGLTPPHPPCGHPRPASGERSERSLMTPTSQALVGLPAPIGAKPDTPAGRRPAGRSGRGAGDPASATASGASASSTSATAIRMGLFWASRSTISFSFRSIEQARVDEAGAGVEAIHGVLRIDGQGGLEDLAEQLGAGILGPDLRQVGPDLLADAVEAVAALAVDDRFGGEDGPPAAGVSLEREDLGRVDAVAEAADPLRFRARTARRGRAPRSSDDPSSTATISRRTDGGNAPWPSSRASAMAPLVEEVSRRIASVRDCRCGILPVPERLDQRGDLGTVGPRRAGRSGTRASARSTRGSSRAPFSSTAREPTRGIREPPSDAIR